MKLSSSLAQQTHTHTHRLPVTQVTLPMQKLDENSARRKKKVAILAF